jgi:hypothetical protein
MKWLRRRPGVVKMNRPARPEVSIVVVAYNMSRVLPRTLRSLSADYQRHISADDYEVIVVDNGSTVPVESSWFDGIAGNFRVIRADPPHPSPAHAINLGLQAACGPLIGVMIDGARLITPGFIHFARQGSHMFERAVVATLGWHLGFDRRQRAAVDAGYTEAREDTLLDSINWPHDGYRLFEIAALDGSSARGWLAQIAESGGLFMRREMWNELGGVDERFDLPGGGLLNLDTYHRAVDLPGAELVLPLGEGTFHQQHGGAASGHEIKTFATSMQCWRDQYEAIRGYSYAFPSPQAPPTFLGRLPREAAIHLLWTALHPEPWIQGTEAAPLGPSFDQSLWSLTPVVRPEDPVLGALVDLVHSEFRAGRFDAATAVARLVRRYAPDEPEPQRLLSHASAWLLGDATLSERSPAMHLALGRAHHLLGDLTVATSEYRAALSLDGNLVAAHLALADLKMPGDNYYLWLERLQRTIRPAAYLEIGVANGTSLAFARPPTIAIGVDPHPCAMTDLNTETHIFAERSDDFFKLDRLAPFTAGAAVEMAFIDGQHHFEQTLKDFMNVEPRCGKHSVILVHDTVPLDEPTQSRERQTQFWSGDVWKAILCLTRYRPDLDIFTVATPPTGLTFVAGLDPTSRVLHAVYDDAVAALMNVRYAEVQEQLYEELNLVPNDWDLAMRRLRNHGTLD